MRDERWLQSGQRMLHLEISDPGHSLDLCGVHRPSLAVCTPWSPDCDWYFLNTGSTLYLPSNSQHAETKHLFWVCCKMRTQEWCPLSSSPPASPGPARVSPITKHSSPSHPQFPQFEVNIRMKINNQFYSYTCWTCGKWKLLLVRKSHDRAQKNCQLESEPWFGDIVTTLAPIGRRSLGFIGQFWVAGI